MKQGPASWVGLLIGAVVLIGLGLSLPFLLKPPEQVGPSFAQRLLGQEEADSRQGQESLASPVSETGERLSDSAGDEGMAGAGDAPAFSQCQGLDPSVQPEDKATLDVINRFLPPGAELHCTLKRQFRYEDEELAFVLLVYGEKTGCPGDCYASNLCALKDSEHIHLYSAFWRNGERPLNIEEACPQLADDSTGNTMLYCNPFPPGYRHPATRSRAFIQLSLNTDDPPLKYCMSGAP